AEIVEDRGDTGDRQRDRARDDRVLRLLVVIRKLECRAAVEQRRVKACLELARVLGAEVDIAESAELDARLVDTRDRRRGGLEEARSGRRIRLHTGRAVRGPQAEGAQPVVVREERLIRDQPREADARIKDALERLTER